MKNLLLYLLLSLSLIACKTEKPQKDITNTTNIPKIDTISYELKRISKEFGDCDTDGGKCTSTEATYVIFKPVEQANFKAVNITIENTIRGTAPTVAASLDSFLAEAKAFYNEFPDVPGGYASELEQVVILNTPTILTVEEFSYAYTGGAHGNYGTGFYNFDVKTGNLITINDLLQEGFELPLRTIAEPIFRAKYLEEGMSKYSEAGFYFEEDVFTLTDNFAITKEGLKFVYNPYEVAPYAMGQQEILIPYKNLADLVKKDGLLVSLK